MSRPSLEATEGQETETRKNSPVASDRDSQLRQRASNKNVHLFLREPVITELARKKDPSVLDLCETLLGSHDADEWQVAVNALAEMKTAAALDRLIGLYCQSEPDDRSYIVQKVAHCLTSDRASSFEKMLKELTLPCEIDVSRWSSSAKAVLGAVSGRLGLTLIYVRSDKGNVCLLIH